MKELFTRVGELTANVISELYCIGMSQSYNSTTHEYNLNTISKTNRISPDEMTGNLSKYMYEHKIFMRTTTYV